MESHQIPQTSDAAAAQKLAMDPQQRLKANILRMVRQLKTGCQKPICFNKNCRKNLLGKPLKP